MLAVSAISPNQRLEVTSTNCASHGAMTTIHVSDSEMVDTSNLNANCQWRFGYLRRLGYLRLVPGSIQRTAAVRALVLLSVRLSRFAATAEHSMMH